VQPTSTVLAIEDDQDILSILEYHLRREPYRVLAARDGSSGLQVAQSARPDLILLDLMLPELSGLEVLKRLRAHDRTRSIPVIILTARTDETDRVLGFELGADDYVTKPFSPRELILRVRSVLRRHEAEEAGQPARMQVGPIELDRENHQVRVDGHRVGLTITEFRLLADLLRARGRVRTRESLLEEIWGYHSEVVSRTIDTHVRRLRHKLGTAAPWLRTVRGVGYRIQDPRED
jgi:two-component system phosphate regulon response regulator PhoB